MNAFSGRGTLAQQSASKLRSRLGSFVAKAGYGGAGSIPEHMGFREWCEDLGEKGLKVDRKPFRLDNRPALLPIYDAIPRTRAEAFERRLVIQKATQLGLTVWEVLADLYMAIKWGPVNIGMFLPSQQLASFKSEERFMAILRSAPPLYHRLTHRIGMDGQEERVGEGNVFTRRVGESVLLFSWTSGKATTESIPMDVVSLDEVQGMSLAEIDKVLARMGDSDVQFGLMLSTAYMPDLDINRWFLLGSQEVWHTLCRECGAESDLSDPVGVFPDRSVGYSDGTNFRAVAGHNGGPPLVPPVNEYVWTCPQCRAFIPDPQVGRYICQAPNANPRIRSFLLPRTISPRITARGMLEGWRNAKTGDQRMSFYNRTLARPYIDADQLPVTIAHCEAAAAEGRRRGLQWEKRAEPGASYYMGIDQMGGWLALLVKKRLPDGRQGTVWAEAVFGDNCFDRATELMRDFRVSVCVLEQLPNVNDARRFANLDAHRGRVFLNTGFNDGLKGDMITWADAATRSDKKTAIEDRSRYSVTLSQYKAMQRALYRVRDLECLYPGDVLEQDVLQDGRSERINLIRDWVWTHFTKTALVIEQDDKERKPKAKVHKVGLDPHFSFANMLCDVAWTREQGGGTILVPPTGPAGLATDAARKVAEAMPGLPDKVLAIIDDLPAGVCGRCVFYDGGKCTERDFNVGARDASCVLYVNAGG